MFPNDDICNVKAAKDAAKRIFQRYRIPVENNKTSDGLGQKQVSSLIKNAYSAINIAYDPSSMDVFSFMSVFGADESGKIELDRLQELAVKYLCGEEALLFGQKDKQKKETSKSPDKVNNNIQQKTQKKHKNEKKELNMQNANISQKNVNQKGSTNLSQSNANIKNLKFLSPRVTQSKNYFSSKQNINVEQKQQVKQVKKLTYSQILNQANSIFNDHKNRQKGGITINQAAVVLQKSYKMMGKNKFSPNEEDVKIWMKLCDMKKNGVVEWASYENFVKRLMERQNIREHQ